MFIAYTRVSTAEQASEGLSLTAQARQLRAYCESRGQPCRLVEDAGVSGRVPLLKRPGGAELLHRVADGEVAGVVAVRLDRLFRDAADCLNVTKAWDSAGVGLHCLDLGVDTSTASGRALLTVMAAFGEMERKALSERVTAALQVAKADGARLGGLSYGWQRGPDRDSAGRLVWHPVPAEQAVLARIHRTKADGATLREIAAQLNHDGIPTRRGGRWHPTSVARALKREVEAAVHIDEV